MSMSVSLQKSSTRTNIKHNNRTMDEKEKEKNTHIDYSRSHENKYLVQEDLKELYEREFGGALEKYNAKQKRHDREIKDYYKHIQSSKKTSVQQEMIIQVGDKDDFSSNDKRELANEVLEDWFKEFKGRNPNLKIYNAVIHNDEASPHLHMNFVPVAGEYKNGLEKQVSFDRAIIQQDSELKKERPFDQWREKEVQLLEEKLNERGIERKLVGKNNYKDVNDYKEKKDLEKEIQLLEKNVVGKKKELIDLSEAIPDKKSVFKNLKKEIDTEVIPKKLGFGKPEIIKKETGNYVLTPKELKNIERTINAAVIVKRDYERLQSIDLVRENKDLTVAFDKVHNSLDFAQGCIQNLEIEKRDLISENRDLKTRVADLTLEIKATYQSVKEFVKEHTKDVRTFKSVFMDLTDKVKGKTSEAREKRGLEPERGEFEKIHGNEVRRERDNELSR